MEINKIYLGDCLNLFDKILPDSVDVIFADPPFNLNKKYNSTKDSLDENEYAKWSKLWINECIRILKPNGSLFLHNIPKWLLKYSEIISNNLIFKHWISWDAPTRPMGKSLQPSHYGILYYTKSEQCKFYEIRHPHKKCRKCKEFLKDYGGKKSQIHPFGVLVSDVWTDIFRVKHKKYKNEHPCQLPIHLIERILLMSSDENDLIFDPFMGTGTTAIASKRLRRNFIGFEKDENYYKIIESNLLKTEQKNGICLSEFSGKIITIRDADVELLLKNQII